MEDIQATVVCFVTGSVPTGIIATVAFTLAGFCNGRAPFNVGRAPFNVIRPLPSLAIVIVPPT